MLRRQKESRVGRCLVILSVASIISVFAIYGTTSADVLKSTNYQLQPTVANSFGGSFGSSNYQLVGSGGEAVIGNGAGGSYKLGAGFVAQLQHSINLYVEPAGLVGYWPMSEDTGPTVHDGSSNSNDGTINGGVSWTDGKIGPGLGFNGSSGEYVALPSGPYTNFGTTDFTVSAWIKTSATDEEVVFSTASSAQGFRFGINAGKPYYLVGSSSSYAEGTIGNTTLNDGKWHDLTITYDYSGIWTVSAYIDDNYVGRVATTASGSANAGSQAMIGAMTPTTHNVNGLVDEVKVYNLALGLEDVKANFEAEQAGFNSGLALPAVQSGHSKVAGADVIVSADAPYTLLTRETSLLTLETDSSVTIPSFSGSIASPASWNEATSQGLGFTILSGPDGVPAKWGGGTKYAAIPLNATSFYSRNGFTGGIKDLVRMQYRIGVNSAQAAGRYKNNVVYTATMTP